MAENNAPKGFTVVDRRIQLEEQDQNAPPAGETKTPGAAAQPAPAVAGPEPPEAEAPAEEERPQDEIPISFISFLLSLHTSALIHLGVIPDPLSKKRSQVLDLARQNIGLLEMLKDKTEGRRTPEENNLLDNILYELRLAYVETVKAAAVKGDPK